MVDRKNSHLRIAARSFQHISAPLRLLSGLATASAIPGREPDRANSRRPLSFCGSTLAREDTLLRQVRAAMGDRCVGVFAAVRAHSPLDSVVAAARDLERLGADAVVPVGGGSAIVTARAASIILAEGGSVESLSTSRDESGRMRSPKLLAPKLPQFVVPTTPTTAIAKAGSAVFDPQGGRRLALFDPKTRAQSIFIQPALVASAPAALVMSAGLNTFSLAMEGLMSRTTDPLTPMPCPDACAAAGQTPSLRRRRAIDDNPVARSDLVVAAILCGQGTDYSGAGITTVLSHATGARHHLENGLLNRDLLAACPSLQCGGRTRRAREDSCIAGSVRAESVVRSRRRSSTQWKAFFRALGVARRLRDIGVPREDLPHIADHAMEDWFLRSNPRHVRRRIRTAAYSRGRLVIMTIDSSAVLLVQNDVEQGREPAFGLLVSGRPHAGSRRHRPVFGPCASLARIRGWVARSQSLRKSMVADAMLSPPLSSRGSRIRPRARGGTWMPSSACGAPSARCAAL